MWIVTRDSLLRPIPWLASFNIDEGQIDAEHRDLIGALNDACAVAGRRPQALELRLGELDLGGMLLSHFATEESLFSHIAYPDALSHRREHDHLRWLFTPLLSAAGQRGGLAPVLHRARTALVEHMIRHDLGYKSHYLYRAGR